MKKKPINMAFSRGLTLVELITVLLLLGVIYSFAVPGYFKSIERGKGKHAAFNLQSIYNAQKRYKLATGSYYLCDPCMPQIKSDLGVDLNDSYFTYRIIAGTGFTAVATRTSGECVDRTMTVTQDGSQTEKECNLW